MQSPIDVLLVDDRPENLMALEAILEAPDLRLVTATSGNDALALTLNHDFAVVLLDVQMPGMDGFETARLMRGSARTRHLPIIFVTAISKEQRFVFEGYESGAVDYLFKPLEAEVVSSKVRVFAELHRQRVTLRERSEALNEANQALQEANQRIQEDLQMAATVQKSLLPSEEIHIEGVSLAWEFQPCEVLGGDIFNVFPLDPEHLVCYVLDVSGHGVSASLLSSALSMVLHPAQGAGSFLWNQGNHGTSTVSPPIKVIERLNRRFPMKKDTCQFFTILYGLLHTPTLQFRYVSAGHPPGIIARSDGSTHRLTVQSPAIGFLPDGSCYQEGSITLQPEDRLCLYSDGLVEARDQDGAMFTSGRLETLWQGLHRHPLPQAVQETFEGIADWRDGPADDDLSLLAVEIQPPPGSDL